MVLLGIIPMIGGIIMLVMVVQESDPGENEYGYPVHIAYDRVFE